MATKAVLLTHTVALVVIIVEPSLTDADDARMRRALDELCRIDVRMMVGVVRVDADAGPDVVLTLGRADNLSPFTLAGGDVQHGPHAGCACARQDASLILDETFIVEMAMAIDQHSGGIRLEFQPGEYGGGRGDAKAGRGERAIPAPLLQRRIIARISGNAHRIEQAGGGTKPCRFIFASSNHAMGGYKDAPLPADGKLRMSTPQISGTRYYDDGYKWGSAYGATKALGERVCAARAAATNGRITAISTRIGWCQRGENLARTIAGSGGGDRGETDEAVIKRNALWYRNMWLSNGDHNRLMVAALRADASKWPGPAIVVSGMSNNTGMAWDLEEARQWIGYVPQDNLWADLKAAGLE